MLYEDLGPNGPVILTQVPKDQWLFSTTFPAKRKHRLQNPPSYEEIVDEFSEQSHLACCILETPKNDEEARAEDIARIIVRIRSTAEIVDLFHNSARGYRAQFWNSVESGEAANRLAIEKLLPRALSLISRATRGQRIESILKASLEPSAMKVWIHQGRWCRYRRLEQRVLEVPRWQAHRNSIAKRAKKLATYASLAPEHETMLDLKGAWVFPDGRSWRPKKLKNRSEEIYKYGFT